MSVNKISQITRCPRVPGLWILTSEEISKIKSYQFFNRVLEGY